MLKPYGTGKKIYGVKREKDDQSRDSNHTPLLSGHSSLPVRLEGHLDLSLASECIITDANRI